MKKETIERNRNESERESERRGEQRGGGSGDLCIWVNDTSRSIGERMGEGGRGEREREGKALAPPTTARKAQTKRGRIRGRGGGVGPDQISRGEESDREGDPVQIQQRNCIFAEYCDCTVRVPVNRIEKFSKKQNK